MDHVQVSQHSSFLVEAGAASISWLHIAGGTAGLLAGAAALGFGKGTRPHIVAGRAFVVAMLVMAALGATAAAFLTSPQGDGRTFDSLIGLLTVYLVLTGWMTVRRKPGAVGGIEACACLFALGLAGAALTFAAQAESRPTGLAGGYPAASYYVFSGLAALAAAFDFKLILKGGVAGVPRLARHLWRMCAALLIAAGAFFLGQQKVMPEAVQGSPLLAVPPLACLLVMAFWLVRLHGAKISRRSSRRPAPLPNVAPDA